MTIKGCSTCKSAEKQSYEAPCASCINCGSYENWESEEAPVPEKHTVSFRKFVIALAATLLITAIAVSISTLKTDIRLMEIQVGMLTDEVVELKSKQEQIESRLRYTVTVKELEVAMQKADDLRNDFEGFSLSYRSLEELIKVMWGNNANEVWR